MKDVFIIRGKAYRRVERPKGNGCTDCAFRNKSCFSLKKVDCYHKESGKTYIFQEVNDYIIPITII